MNLSYYKKQKLPPQYTESFRDPEVWEKLKELLLISNKKSATSDFLPIINYRQPVASLQVFRAWSAGCATGEEAYSLANILGEVFEEERVHWKVYATDIVTSNQKSVISKMNAIDTDYRLLVTDYSNRLRFRQHDLITDEPLKYMNLILCRNVLMFFTQEYQEIICDKLYNSLRTGGYLVLGKGEHLRGEVTDKLVAVNKKLRIFQKI